jgi:predicted outer membrane repeat protein
MRLPLLLSLLFLTIGTQCMATRYHVNVAATGEGTGLTWANAFTDLQEALSVVVPGDEIWVAAGQYRPTSGNDRTVSFVLRDGVDLYGGFAGTETSVEERDINANPTTLNGDIGQLGEVSDNSYAVLRGNNITFTQVVDGFRIINANGPSGQNGGGLRLTNALGGLVIVRNCTFFSNRTTTYGGAIYLAASNLTAENCVFQSNESGSGGAILNGNNNGGYSNLVLRDCEFKGNTANIGACLDNTVRYETLVIDRCFFTNNLSANNVIVIDDFLSAKLMNSAIIGNSVNGFSSEVLRVNTFGSSTAPFDMINCTIAHNRNTSSSPIQSEIVQLEDNHMRMSNCIVHGNTAYAGRQMRTGPIVQYSLVQGGYASGTAVVDADPQFTAPNTTATSNFDATAFDYHPLPSSPAINAGSNDLVPVDALFDLDGEERIQGGVVDLGCYESDLTVGIAERPTAQGKWYFDAEHGVLHVTDLGTSGALAVEVLTLSGQLVERITVRQSDTRLVLPAGMYVARSEGLRPLRFVVGGQ